MTDGIVTWLPSTAQVLEAVSPTERQTDAGKKMGWARPQRRARITCACQAFISLSSNELLGPLP